MRKATLTVVALVGLSLLLCGSGEVLAQAQTGLDARNAEDRDATAQTAGGAGASSAELGQSVLQLQSEVAQLRQELAQVRAELANITANMGVGGSGQAGAAPAATQPGTTADQDRTTGGTAAPGTVEGGTAAPGAVAGGTTGQGTAPRGNMAQGTTARGPAARGPDTSGEAVVNAIYTGTVRSVSGRQLVLVDEAGQPFTVELGDRTRVLRNGQRISAQELKQGTRVRATVDLLSGHNQATEITTLPAR